MRSLTKPRDPPRHENDPDDLNAALDDLLRSDEAGARADAAARRPPSSRTRNATLVVLIAAGVWLLIAPPAWMIPPDAVAPLAEHSPRTIAVDLVSQADRLVTQYRDVGVLPPTYTEIGAGQSAILYRTTGPAAFELSAIIGDSTLVLPVVILRGVAPEYEVTQTGGSR